jgi:hypothetical protein
VGHKRRGDVKTAKSLLEGVAVGAFMGEAVGQSQPTESVNGTGKHPNCHCPEPVTQAFP